MILKNPDEDVDKISPEEHLWRAVLHQALKDAISRQYGVQSNLDREEAIWWIKRALRKKNRKFVEICDLSGMDVGFVRTIFKRELEKVGIL